MARPRAAPLLGVLLLASCRASPAVTEPVELAPAPIEAAAEPGCRVFAGPPGDVDLRGLPREHEARCCPSDYGFEPELARRSCGFADYLGESEELACVHRFRGRDGDIHELRISPILDLEFADAVALHQSGEFGPDHVGAPVPELPELWSSSADGRRWILIPGEPLLRRLSWDEAACGVEQMLPVLADMRDAELDEADAVALPRLRDEPASAPQPGPSLLERGREPPIPERRYSLPREGPQLAADLLAAAAAADREGFVALLDPGARIGLPDRRQLGAVAIADEPARALQRLRDAAARLPADTPLRCPALDRRVRAQVARGEAPMWCVWMSADGLDLIAVGLRGRIVDGSADARVAYLGVFPVRPAAALALPGEPPPPPVVPVPDLVCGDPHTIAYPDLCPSPATDEADDDDDGEEDQP